MQIKTRNKGNTFKRVQSSYSINIAEVILGLIVSQCHSIYIFGGEIKLIMAYLSLHIKLNKTNLTSISNCYEIVNLPHTR